MAYSGTLPGRGRLLFVLTSGHEFADGDAGGLCLGSDTDGVEFRPFAVIGVTRQVCNPSPNREGQLVSALVCRVLKRLGHAQQQYVGRSLYGVNDMRAWTTLNAVACFV